MASSSPSPSPAQPHPPPPLNSTTIQTEYARIISAHSRHFLTLSLIFLPIFPIFLSPFLFPTLHKIKPLLVFSLFISSSYLIAIGSITHSVRHVFHYTTPLTLSSSIKSSISSFFPLFTTALSAQFPVFGTLLLSRLLFQLSGIQSEFNFLVSQALTVGFVVLQLSCGLAYAVAVVESKWGFRAWKRSFDLMIIMKKEEEEDPRNSGLGNYYCRLILAPGFRMCVIIWPLSTLADGPLHWGLSVLLTCLILPCSVTELLGHTMSFAVLYMRLSLPIDDVENQVQAPLLDSVVN